MAEGAKQATRAVPGAAGRAREAGRSTGPARVPRRMFREPGQAAERNAGARAARAGRGPSSVQGRSPREQDAQAGGTHFAPPDVQEKIEQARGGGQALDTHICEQLQPHFDHKIRNVRLHTDSRADALSRAVNARAFTVGTDIFFRAGAYAPGTMVGQVLLGHELTHVYQQDGASMGPRLEIGPAGDDFERAADQAVGGLVHREKQVTVRCQRHEPEVLDYPPELIFYLPPGVDPAMFIQEQVNRMKDSLGDYWTHYRDGLLNFQTSMEFSSEQEAESHYLKSILTAGVKVDLDLFLDGVIEGCPGLGPYIKLAKEAIGAVIEEHERVEKAEGEVKIVEFIEERRNAVGEIETKVRDELIKRVRPMQVAYAEVARGTGGETAPDSSGVSGPGAQLLQDLEREQKRLHDQIEKKSVAIFQQYFTESFASVGSSYVGPLSAGDFKNATMYLNCRVYRNESGVYSLQSIDDSWDLKTNAPEPKRVASSLAFALKAQKKEPFESNLEKVVRATLEIESGHVLSLNSYDDTSYTFTNIEHVSFGTADAVLHGNNPAEFREAWDAVLKAKVKGTKKLRGSGP